MWHILGTRRMCLGSLKMFAISHKVKRVSLEISQDINDDSLDGFEESFSPTGSSTFCPFSPWLEY